MKFLLLFLFLGVAVALEELSFEDPAFAESLSDEGEEIMGEFADEENDALRSRPSFLPSHRPRPSGHPVAKCCKKLKGCLKILPGHKKKCFKRFYVCLKAIAPSVRPSLPFTIPPEAEEHLKMCFKPKPSLSSLSRRSGRPSRHPRPSGRPSRRPRPSGRPSRRPRPNGRPSGRPSRRPRPNGRPSGRPSRRPRPNGRPSGRPSRRPRPTRD